MRKSKRLKENIGIHGAGMDKFDLMRTLGLMGPALHKGGPVELDEVIKVAKAINDAVADPDDDNIVAYSRGAAILAQAVRLKMIDEMPRVVMLAPAIYRGWTTAPAPKLPFGSYVMIGERDDKVSIKQACRAGIDSGVPVWVVPGLSHTGILYTHGAIPRDAYEIDSASYLSDRSTPDWGRSPKATQEELQKQVEMASTFSFNKRESRASIVLRDLIRETVLLLELRNAPNDRVPTESKYYARPIAAGYVLYYAVGPGGEPVEIPGSISEDYRRCSGKDYDLTPEQLRKAEELVALGLYEKSSPRKEEYKDSTFKYLKRVPGSAGENWKKPSDIPDTHIYYGPVGANFEYLLVDTVNKRVSLDATWTDHQSRRGASTPKKTVKDKSYVMPSGDVAFVGKEIALKKLFNHLMQVDPRVTPDYKIFSPDDKYEGQTIGQAGSAPRTTDIAVGGVRGTIMAYHGTTTARWPDIEKKGMLPGKFEDAYGDQIEGYSSKNLYFTMDPHTAENYATRSAIWYGGKPLILKVEIPDITRIVPDEDNLSWFNLDREYTLTQSDRIKKNETWNPETYGWNVTTTSEPGGKHTIAREQHFKNIIRTVRLANTTVAYGKDIGEAPEAGLEWAKDEEFSALMKDIDSKIMSFLTTGITRKGTFAYRGWIPPKFIKRWKEYPKKAYPKVVDTGKVGGTGDEYQETRKDVLSKVKRFEKNESLVRSLVRGILNESSPPSGFTSSTTHSVGWIDPDGVYHYNPEQRDHGEWAAFHIGRNPSLMPQFEAALEVECGPIDPPPPRTPEEQAVYDAKSPMGKKMDDWKRQGGRPLTGKTIPEFSNMGELYYNSDIQSEVRSVAMRTLLRNGWGKVSNAYSLEIWKPTRTVVNAWLDLGMNAGSDPERYHNIFDNNKPLAEGDWQAIESFMKRLP